MDHVPLEVQVMILERTHPDALYAAHQVKKSWRSYILEKDDRLRDDHLSEECMTILKSKCRAASRNQKMLIVLEKELNRTMPRVLKWIWKILTDVSKSIALMKEELMLERIKLGNKTELSTEESFKLTGRRLKIVSRHCRDFYEIASQEERTEIERDAAKAGPALKDVGPDALDKLADRFMESEFELPDPYGILLLSQEYTSARRAMNTINYAMYLADKEISQCREFLSRFY